MRRGPAFGDDVHGPAPPVVDQERAPERRDKSGKHDQRQAERAPRLRRGKSECFVHGRAFLKEFSTAGFEPAMTRYVALFASGEFRRERRDRAR